jgi:hypothetical protein
VTGRVRSVRTFDLTLRELDRRHAVGQPVFHAPGHIAPARVETIASQMDVAPTLRGSRRTEAGPPTPVSG